MGAGGEDAYGILSLFLFYNRGLSVAQPSLHPLHDDHFYLKTHYSIYEAYLVLSDFEASRVRLIKVNDSLTRAVALQNGT